MPKPTQSPPSLSFTEWYLKTHNDWWHEDYAELCRFAEEMTTGYEEWCRENNATPIWDG